MKKDIKLKFDRTHPKWCNYPVTGEGHPVIDMCWGFLYGYVKKQGKKYCKNCEFINVEEKIT